MFAFVLLLFITTRFATQAPDNQTVIPPGQIVERVVCARDPNQTYALYLPSNYVSSRTWPVLYAFDPGARGKIPIEHFKEAAERFGWIIVGSNNSRNGSVQSSIEAWNAITRDTTERFSINDGRAYAAGFSGGARMALMLATQCKDCLAGVIASGAGFPEGIEPAATMHFALFSTAGTEDFNFAEVKSLDEKLTRAGITHQIEIFEGRHEWPPASVAVNALAWMELKAFKPDAGQLPSGLTEWWNSRLKAARELEDAKKVYDAYQVYAELISAFKGLRDVVELENKVNELRNSHEVRDAIRDEQQQIRKQRELEGQVMGLVAASERVTLQGDNASSNRTSQTNDDGLDAGTRLQGILNELRRQSKAEQDSASRRVARRVMSGQYIGLFERGSNYLQNQKRYDEAIRFFTLATEVDPERPGAFYYLAWAYNSKGDRKKSLKALQTAVDKGFSDAAALESNKAFDSLRDDPQFQKIIGTLKVRR
ncbi:MAG TPA: dienelactone hydrolase family protein [Pyrinomonadaceae bacterium]|nr:dienelactone hydrolase family protein [Pyrinomonadaceae bacterium]